MRIIYTIFLLIACLFGKEAWAQLSITSAGTTYAQDFNTLAQSGSTNPQSGGIFDAGWSFLETGSNANNTYADGTGSIILGDTYSLGVEGTNSVNDRALGMLQSSSLSSIIGFKFTNNTGFTITSITIEYTGEVWKLSSKVDSLQFSYQVGDVDLNTYTSWIPVPTLSFATPKTGSAAVDGNATAYRTITGPVIISGLNIPNSTTVTMRWVDATSSASAGMGIDDFTISLGGSIYVPPPTNDDCINATTLTPATSPVAVTGTFGSATPTSGLTNAPTKNDVWYKFKTTCSGSDSIVVSYTSATGVNVDFEVFANSCPVSGASIVTAFTANNPESKYAAYPGGAEYYIRVIDGGGVSAGSFKISVFTVAPSLAGTTITGSSTPCYGNTITYSLSSSITGASYAWTLPGMDWTGSSNTSSINVVAGSSAGNLTVIPTDGCGFTGKPLSKAIKPVTLPVNVSGAKVSAGNGQLTVSWTSPDCYEELMVVATNKTNVTLIPSGDGLQYVDTSEYASQNKNNGTNMNPGEYCVYKGSSSAVAITGLLNASAYRIKIFTRWGTQWSSGIQVSGVPTAISTGTYRSVKSGLWTSNAIWNKYNGSTWVATSGSGDYPNNYTADVIIQSGHIVQLNTSFNGPVPVRNLTVESNAQLWTGDQDSTGLKNKYIAVFGNIICNGIIGNTNPNTLDNICFGIEGALVNISGTGSFSCTRIRKNFDASTTGAANSSNLNINMNINLLWSGTALYNNAANGINTTFNVTLQPNYILTLKNTTGSVAIDGIAGNTNNSYSGGKFTINGTLIIPGTLYLMTDNTAAGVPCTIEIGSAGKVYTNTVNAGASGTAGHTLTINNGGLLRITDAAGFGSYSSVNNSINLLTGSTVEYAATGDQEVLSGLTYSNLLISGSGEKALVGSSAIAKVNGILNINTGNALALNDKTVYLNGIISGSGSLTGSTTSKLIIGPDNILTSTPLGMLRFTPGSERLHVLTLDRYMNNNTYPNHKYWAAVLGSNLSVDSLNLRQGIIATDRYLLTLLSYPVNSYVDLNKASYIATTDTLATGFPLVNTFDGNYGFRISGVKANADTYFPVGTDFISPNRVMINLGNDAATRDMTVMLTKGYIGYTGSPRVNRVWYIKSSVDDSINARVQLYYTAYSLYDYSYLTKQDELETGFTGINVRLVEKAALSDPYFTSISNVATDIRFNPSNNGEAYGQYSTASIVSDGTHPGVYKFGIFSIVDGNNVVLPVSFIDVRIFQYGKNTSINWAVVNETGIDHYEVERAGDGRVFSVVATQRAQNWGRTGNRYSATDKQPFAGSNYYRIKAVSKDGQVFYSTIVNITLSNDIKESLLVYPNPIKNNYCNVVLANLAAGTYNIGVYSVTGQLVALKKVKHVGGSSSLRLNLSAGTAMGVYIVKLTGDGVSMQTSVFVSEK
jgi:hypothetical protein